MLSTNDYLNHDAVGLAQLRANGDVSAVELLRCALTLTEQLNPDLNAVVHLAAEQALQRAQALDTQKVSGPLAGVPFLIKEVNAVKDWPHTRSTPLYRSQIAGHDSAVVHRYQGAGLLPFGSTNTPELCLTITTEHSLFGVCRNPHNTAYSAGGSSGGAAAAVAAGIVPAADASDGGGSIRVPAACCGLIGLKPSRGLTVTESDMGSAWSGMSVSHVVCRSVRDSAAFLDVLALHKPDLFAVPHGAGKFLDNHARALQPLTVAVQRSHPAGLPIDPECLAAVDLAAQRCQALGHHIEEATPPVDYTRVGQAMATLINVHAAQLIEPGLHAQEKTLEQARLSESAHRMVARGLTTNAGQYLQALDVVKQAERQMAQFHQHYDLLLSPVLALPPAELGWLDMNATDIREYARRYASYSPFTALFNGTGQPSIALPMTTARNGLPIAVMFSAAWGQDLRLLQLASSLIPGVLPSVTSLKSN